MAVLIIFSLILQIPDRHQFQMLPIGEWGKGTRHDKKKLQSFKTRNVS